MPTKIADGEVALTRDEVIERLMQIIWQTFNNDDVRYADSLTAQDVDGWDSLSNISFMVELESEFGLQFSIGQWQSFANLGDLVDHILTRG